MSFMDIPWERPPEYDDPPDPPDEPPISLYSFMKEHPMFESAMFGELLSQFCAAAHKNSKDKGFWDEGRTTVVPHISELQPMGPDWSLTAPSEPVTGIPLKQRPVNLGEKYMLMVSELCELFEAHRKGILEKPCDKDATVLDPAATEPYTLKCQMCAGSGVISVSKTSGDDYTSSTLTFPVECTACGGKGTVITVGVRRLTNEEEEVADLAIRLADYCGYRNIDLGRAILSKMAYNSTRPYMHNRTC